MKQVVLVRHGKAVQWGYESDSERELTERGERDADRVSKYMRSQHLVPDLIITSDAARARHTALIFAANFDYPGENIMEDPQLYFGYSTEEFLSFIKTLPQEHERVFFFGHNPSFEYYARGICKFFNREMGTSSAVVISFDIENWSEMEARSGEFLLQVNPKDLNE